jgi:hypothetical protein
MKRLALIAAQLRGAADGLEVLAGDYELREAVVEAARKAAAAWRGNRVGLASLFAAVTDAVDALERAEGEE